MHGRTPNVHHGCISFKFWTEVHSNNRGAPVDFRGCCHGLSRAFPRRVPRLMLLQRKMPRGWPLHVPQFCPWQTPWYQPWQPTEVGGSCHGSLRGNCSGISTAIRGSVNHQGIAWPSAAIAEVSMDIQLQQFPRPSAAVRGHCHRNCPMLMHIC